MAQFVVDDVIGQPGLRIKPGISFIEEGAGLRVVTIDQGFEPRLHCDDDIGQRLIETRSLIAMMTQRRIEKGIDRRRRFALRHRPAGQR